MQMGERKRRNYCCGEALLLPQFFLSHQPNHGVILARKEFGKSSGSILQSDWDYQVLQWKMARLGRSLVL